MDGLDRGALVQPLILKPSWGVKGDLPRIQETENPRLQGGAGVLPGRLSRHGTQNMTAGQGRCRNKVKIGLTRARLRFRAGSLPVDMPGHLRAPENARI